ncbi:MAG: hypothetical protein J0M20_06180 [Burkholderiales bacterium]|nr:hypothetical protein [Burkholderiales bacterium]
MPENFYRPAHGRTLNWYVRLVPPKALRGVAGVKEYRQSTGTADLRRAKTIGTRLIADKRAEWDKVLQTISAQATPQVLTEELIEHVCAQRAYHWLRLDDRGRFEGAGFDEQAERALLDLCEVTDRTMQAVVRRGPASPEWAEVLDLIDTWCVQLGYSVSRTDPRYPQLVRAYATAERQAVELVRRRFAGDGVATPAQPAAPSPLLSAMTEPYREHKARSTKHKQVSTSVSVWQKLVDFLGDVPLSSVTGQDLYRFYEARLNADEHPWSMKYAHGVARRVVREVFELALTLDMMSGTNPDTMMKALPRISSAEEATRRKPRFPFADDQLTALFASDWYRPDWAGPRGKMRGDLGARYWVPLVSLFHGNRVSEVTQLMTSDVEVLAGLPVLHLRTEYDEDGTSVLADIGVERSLKTPDTYRTVPVHPELLRLGFLEFAQARSKADGPSALLFPSSMPNRTSKQPKLGRSYQQAFLRHVQERMGLGKGFANHSFRHQLEDRIRDAQVMGQAWPVGLNMAYTGRKRQRDADKGQLIEPGSERLYGRGFSPKVQLPYIASLDFSRVKLPPPYAEWLKASGRAHDL